MRTSFASDVASDAPTTASNQVRMDYPRPIPIPMSRQHAQAGWPRSASSSPPNKVMRFKDVPKDSTCLTHVERNFYIAFSVDSENEPGPSLRTPEGENFTHFVRLSHPPPKDSAGDSDDEDDEEPTLASKVDARPNKPSLPPSIDVQPKLLSLVIPPNALADVQSEPPVHKITDERLDAMHKFLQPAGLGITLEKLRSLLIPEEDRTEFQNSLNVTNAQLRAAREFVKLAERDEGEKMDDGHPGARFLITTPRDRRTDGMSVAIACLASLGTDKARQIIARLDEREEEGSVWYGVVENSMAGKLDGDTLF